LKRLGWVLAGLAAAALLTSPTIRFVRSLAMTRGGMAAFTALVASANAQDVEAVRSLCSRRYLGSHAIERAAEGGVVGLPRNIHKNFQVWTEGDEVRLCPTNRVGPVYRLVREGDAWKFDGLVGRLVAGGRLELDATDPDFL
jgi:hypothetical protein